LAAPSANPFGYISPTSATHVRDSLSHTNLRAVLDGGECRVGVESTIVDLTNSAKPLLLRPGGLDAAAIERVLGKKLARPVRKTIAAGTAAPAPGMLSRHYSPRTPLTLHTRLNVRDAAKLPPDEVCLLLRKPGAEELCGVEAGTLSRLRWLSERGDLAEVARTLFTALRNLDNQKWKRIHAARAPGLGGLAPAINDRLERASAKR
jgi:L-threonylcarbamoyladenylate synthase